MDLGRWHVGLALALVIAAEAALALGGSGGGGLPWESPLRTLQSSLTGPVAMVIAVLAMAVAGAALVFGGEMGDFVRRILMVVLGIAVLLLGTSLITALFPTAAGAVV